ncbi:hypothetical protein EHI8A_067480 [Entamoeba histolytica HM-1:IMSS-B]|uniref:COMM domain-containing protein n=5 Tax=Entamoeba histolytica TaxID=5759 RepID=C4LTM4_ENTH1|nr:hypothetical protein EHI_012310 [Entamoeba histolytica HM-1:IMSS]EMD43822.1 Hypothetical protein EHI5A_093930 [Entamoeba histolytica KU27]EMH78297.1 hypothetical protein EHI8A_067480 [Entamoeba histolytica HM-1:IMSS-B]EMS11969.1 hypothetical protein KM1_122880 [Entamoeba histolytica HM-3:IMSS]GAT91917.1 hypothetical protein CL6EHI_012310 [Entamoeba histolytica]EAL50792.1 hypothetical protein EHI_012310 [Entamoeba histolytica HM-1:IMSS]|eukprot:XP_656176.1 hypothetical protein EHI_012310 [Entamoeba histolytica HM-1:IMSS]
MENKEVITKSNGVNKRYVVRLIKSDDFNIEDKPIFIDLSWRLDIVLAYKNVYKLIQPQFIIQIDVADITLAKKDQKKVIQSDGSVKVALSSLRKSIYFEMTPMVLNEVIKELEKGIAELRSLNTKQILHNALKNSQ